MNTLPDQATAPASPTHRLTSHAALELLHATEPGPQFVWMAPEGAWIAAAGAAAWDGLTARRRWLVGALPFARPSDGDWTSGGLLFEPLRVVGAAGGETPTVLHECRGPASPFEAGRLAGWPGIVPDEVERDAWIDAAERALVAIRSGGLNKVVLAKPRRLRAAATLDPFEVLARMEEAFPDSYRFAVLLAEHGAWIGASPERLVALEAGTACADAVAGTIEARGGSTEDLARRLLVSAKDRREHRHVVDHLIAGLRDAGGAVGPEEGIAVIRHGPLLHLKCKVSASFPSAIEISKLVEDLHPTPAVLGSPPASAARLLPTIEPWPRGLYAGPVGWCRPSGEGDFAVGIRAAWIQGRDVVLFAGAGIVADSEPAREWVETEAKLASIAEVVLGA